jgi:type IV secretory pathway TrbD component
MNASDLFTLLALVVFLAASVVGFIHKSWVPALFCLGVAFLVIAGANVITD